MNTARATIYESARAKAIKEWLVEAKALVAAAKQPKPATEDDGYANPDDYVDRMGRYYSSEYVAACKPWERKLPFEEWLERRRIGEVKRG